jgi:hypothetical protein
LAATLRPILINIFTFLFVIPLSLSHPEYAYSRVLQNDDTFWETCMVSHPPKQLSSHLSSNLIQAAINKQERKDYEAETAKEKWIKWIQRHAGMCSAWRRHQSF